MLVSFYYVDLYSLIVLGWVFFFKTGERLFPLIQAMHANLAGKITGMLLEIDNSELLHMLESHESLRSKVHCYLRLCHVVTEMVLYSKSIILIQHRVFIV